MTKRNGLVYVEQVPLDHDTSRLLLEEARRRGVSRAHVGREAIERFLGVTGEGRWEPKRKDTPEENYGRR